MCVGGGGGGGVEEQIFWMKSNQSPFYDGMTGLCVCVWGGGGDWRDFLDESQSPSCNMGGEGSKTDRCNRTFGLWIYGYMHCEINRPYSGSKSKFLQFDFKG